MLAVFGFMIAICAGIALIGSLFFIPEFIECFKKRKQYQYIDFKSFQHFYTVSQKRWVLEKDCVKFCKLPDPEICRMYRNTDDYFITLHFHFKDRRQYKKWKRTHEKQEQQIASIESMQEILSIIKKDIDKFNKENEARIDEATDNIDTIISRMIKL